MSKRKHKRQTEALFSTIIHAVASADHDADALTAQDDCDHGNHDLPITDAVLAASPTLAPLLTPGEAERRELRRMKKFRFQLLHEWIVTHITPCRVADVGGGKGLLAYLLSQHGWPVTVIDPIHQPLPSKYKDLSTARQVRIPVTDSVPRIDHPFEPGMARDFDLLVAMHAHGCNVQLMDAAADYGRRVILLPCCVIHEPIVPTPGVHWIQCVVEYAVQKGLSVTPFRLNFRGQNIGLYMRAGE
jgi:hypothetical protein